MSKLILTDVDETILAFADPFQEWMENEKGFKSEDRLLDHYNIEKWLGVDRAAAIDLMSQFGKADVSYLNRPDALAEIFLPHLYSEGYRFVAITACGMDPVYAARRTQIIADTFGFTFEGIHYVDYRESKRTILDSFKPAIWVEDNATHAADGADSGHRSYLIDRPYNRANPSAKVIQVADWRDIYIHNCGILASDASWMPTASLKRGLLV